MAKNSSSSTTTEQMEELPVTWINDNYLLNKLLEDLVNCHTVALDTEFIKRDTYYPILALIQINTGKEIYLVDVPKLDLSQLWQVLTDLPVMIWHSCSEDLTIFYQLSNLPPLTNIFDTQIALAYLTGKLQVGYQQAVNDILDIHLAKAHSQSDWLQRPLDTEQEHYAVDDVRYLLPLYYQLKEQLTDKNLYNFVCEDCQTQADDIYQANNISDDEQYLSALEPRHSGLQRYFLKELLAWRERLARATNQPRTFILRKRAIRELLELMPTSIRQLNQQTTIHYSIVKQYGNEILKIIRQAKNAKVEDYPSIIYKKYRSKNKILQRKINNSIRNYAEKTGVPENLLMKKKWQDELLQAVAFADNDKIIELPKGLQGWRKQWIKTELIPLLKENQLELKEGMS